jgi:peptide/nickel transport system permease protein
MARISARWMAMRTLSAYFTLLVIMTIIFALIRSMPGDFVQSMIGPGMDEGQIEALYEEWGNEAPLWEQYINYMINYQTLEFGYSTNYSTAVLDVVVRRAPRTLILFGASYIWGVIMGPLVGMYLGWWRGTRKDKSIFATGLLMRSMPAFWLAWLFIWLFNYNLGWLPSSYMFTQFPANQWGWSEWTVLRTIYDVLYHIALPLGSLMFAGWVGSMLVMRPTMINVTNEDYVFLAKAKGLSERTVMIKHAARNALIPVATGAIISIAFIISGSVIIENVFSWPGLGQVIVTAVFANDVALAQASFFLLGVLIVFMRVVQDIVYVVIDPRIQFGEQE